MARPRKHQTEEERRQAHAASQRAWRRRQGAETIPVDRAAAEGLMASINAAAAVGDALARRVRTTDVNALLRNLARAFREAAAGPAGSQ